MRRAIVLLALWGLSACAPRIPPPDGLWEADEDLAERVRAHETEIIGRGRIPVAIATRGLERTLTEIAGEYDTKSPQVCQSLTDAGVMLIDEEPKIAVGYFEKALTACEAAYGHEHRETSYALHDYSISMDRAAAAGYEPRALHGFEEALAVRRRILGDQHEETAAAEVSLGKHLLAGCRAEPPCAGADVRLERARGLARHAIQVFASIKDSKRSDQTNASNLLIDVVAQRGSVASDPSPR